MYILTYKIVYHKSRYQCAITKEMRAVPFNCGPDFKGCGTLIIALPKCYSKVGVYQRSSGMLTYSDRGSRKLSPVSGPMLIFVGQRQAGWEVNDKWKFPESLWE